MNEYPPDLPAVSRARIERAMVEAEDAYAAAIAPPDPATLDRLRRQACRDFQESGVMIVDVGDPDIPGAALQYALTVCDVLVREVCDVAREQRWTADHVRTVAEAVRDQCVAATYREKHPTHIKFKTFRAHVYDELRTSKCWAYLQQAIRERTSDARVPGRVLRNATIGKQLGVLRQEARWTIEDLAEHVGIDRANVLRHLAGKGTPRPDHVRKYEQVFSARLNRIVRLDR